MNNQIDEARNLLNKALKINDISLRNNTLQEAQDLFKTIEESDLDQKEVEKVRNIKRAYSKELLQNLYPTPSVDQDLVTTIILYRFNSDSLEFNFNENPLLKEKFDKFLESLRRSPEFHKFLKFINKDENS